MGRTIINKAIRKFNGETIYFVFIDESGHPYYEDERPFVMDALVTPDPERLAAVAHSIPTNTSSNRYWGLPGRDELKHSRTNQYWCDQFIRKVDLLPEVRRYGVAYRMNDDGSFPEELAKPQYDEAFRRITRVVAEDSSGGIYKFRIDSSDYFDKATYTRMARSSFDGTDAILPPYNPVLEVESAITPAIQSTDMFVGEHAKAIRNNRGERFERAHRVKMSKNRKIGKRRFPQRGTSH